MHWQADSKLIDTQDHKIPTTNSTLDGGLTDSQKRALNYVGMQARLAQEWSRVPLLERVRSLGFSPDDVSRALTFIRDAAPVVIHIKPEFIDLFNKDTHYRSQHETATSGGALDLGYRDTKEATMFGEAYRYTSGREKPKYGALNPTLDPMGVSCAAPRFGDCFFILKESVKRRCTAAGKGSKGGLVNLGTMTSYSHCLLDYSDEELSSLMETAKAWKQGQGGRVQKVSCVGHEGFIQQGSYKEVQIHGDIVFSRDVEALVLHPSHMNSQWVHEAASTFSQRFNVRVERWGASRWSLSLNAA